jgi:hypothetical protein
VSVRRVWLCGEGKSELGGWDGDPAYRKREQRGVLVALLERAGENWEIAEATQWSKVPKMVVKAGWGGDAGSVRKLVMLAKNHDAIDILVFSRDRDNLKEREQEIEEALGQTHELAPDLRVVGGTANECIESWVLAFMRENADKLRKDRAQKRLTERGVESLDEMLVQIQEGDLADAESRSESLKRWMDRAREALSVGFASPCRKRAIARVLEHAFGARELVVALPALRSLATKFVPQSTSHSPACSGVDAKPTLSTGSQEEVLHFLSLLSPTAVVKGG